MNKKRILIIAACVVLIGACVLVYTLVIVPNTKYNNAVKAMQNKQYTEASIAFQELKNYKDSETRLLELHANELFDSGSYAEVVDMYATLPAEYQDHADDLIAMYADASAKRDEGKFDEAISIFTSLGNYTDCSTQIKQTLYLKAGSLADNGQYDDAIRIYTDLGSYSDAADQIPETKYRKAAALAEAGEYNDAIALYKELGDYKDSSNLALKAYADGLYARGNIADAYEVYKNLEEGYQTHSEDYKVQYDDAVALRTAGKYDEAIFAFESLGEYSDARTQVVETKYQKAASLAAAGEYSSAQKIYKELGQYKDSAVLARKMNADDLYTSGLLADAYEIYKSLDEKYQTHIDDYKALYDKALAKRDNGEYAEAKKILNSLGTYPDAANQIIETSYLEAIALAKSGEYDEAIWVFESLSGYKDSASLIKKAKADQCYDSGDFAGAYEIYSALEEKYQSHAADYEAFYDNAVTLRSEGKYDDAMIVFQSLGAYSDANVQITETVYQKAASLAESGDYSAAIRTYEELGDYKDSPMLAEKTAADQLYASGDIAGAYDAYVKLDEAYQSHIADYKALYDNALAKQADGQFDEALSIFASLGKYPGAEAQIIETNYLKASALSSSGDYDAAIAIFEAMPDYKDSTDLMKKTRADKLYAYGHYAQASEIYKDLEEKYQTHLADYQAAYAAAEALLANKEFDKASLEFLALGSFSDSSERAEKCLYEKAEYLLGLRDYTGAAEVYKLLGESEKANQALYDNAAYLREQGDYTGAAKAYEALGNSEKANQVLYDYAAYLREQGDYIEAAKQYTDILNYSDSEEQRYLTALVARDAGKEEDAIAILGSILDYRDASEDLYQIAKKASGEQHYDISTKAFAAVGAYKDSAMSLSKDTYAWGAQLFENGEYDYSAEVFGSMGDFSDALERTKEAKYEAALQVLNDGKYEDARERFEALKDYKDSTIMLKETYYRPAKKLYEDGQYEAAYECFSKGAVRDYEDSASILRDCKYQIGKLKLADAYYLAAKEWFDGVGDYLDSKELSKECDYQMALSKKNQGQYDEAIKAFEKLADYSDSEAQARACYKSKGESCEADKDYEQAFLLYESAEDSEKMQEMAYLNGMDRLAAGDSEAAVIWLDKAEGYKDSKEQIFGIADYYLATKQYEEAEAACLKILEMEGVDKFLYEIGQYYEQNGQEEKADIAYHESGDYAFEKVYKTYYDEAIAQREQQHWDEAFAAFEKAKDYKDTAEQITETYYQKAKDLYERGDYDAAFKIYLGIREYKDVSHLLLSDANLVSANVAQYKKKGNIVVFGHYEQDNDTTNGPEKIEWIVLDVLDGKCLLLSKYGLDTVPYNTTDANVYWDDCSLRGWLNNTFLNKAFTNEEQDSIIVTTVDNRLGEKYKKIAVDPAFFDKLEDRKSTEDKIFLLNFDEANEYLGVTYYQDKVIISKGQVSPTAYAVSRGAYVDEYIKTEDGSDVCNWWLRSHGTYGKEQTRVAPQGYMLDWALVYDDAVAVRPVLWLDLESDFYKYQF